MVPNNPNETAPLPTASGNLAIGMPVGLDSFEPSNNTVRQCPPDERLGGPQKPSNGTNFSPEHENVPRNPPELTFRAPNWSH